MTKPDAVVEFPPLTVTIDAMLLRHGRLAVLAATLTGLLRAGLLHRDIDAMPEHMRRDIGLPPLAEPPRPREHMW